MWHCIYFIFICVALLGCSSSVFTSDSTIDSGDSESSEASRAKFLDRQPDIVAPEDLNSRPRIDSKNSSTEQINEAKPAKESIIAPAADVVDMAIEEDIQLEPSAKELLEDCGAINVIRNDPAEVFFRRNIRSSSFNITKNGITAKVGMSDFWDVSPGIFKQKIEVKVIQLITAESTAAIQAADKIAQERSGEIIAETILQKNMLSLADQSETWNKIFCTVSAANSIEVKRASFKTKVAFNPPLPLMLSPRANIKRYTEEIGDRRDFPGITAKINSSNDPVLKDKTNIVGSVSIIKVGPSFKSDVATIHGDIAFQILIDFGSPEITHALGLVPASTYFIVVSRKDYAGSINQSRLNGEMPIVFVD